MSDSVGRRLNGGNQTSQTIKRVTNDAGLELVAAPGGGALSFGLGYHFLLDWYDRDNNAVALPETLDRFQHMPFLKVDWSFLPKTKLFFDTRLAWSMFPNSGSRTIAGETIAIEGSQQDTAILTAEVGASGAITSRITALARVGYGHTFLLEGDGDSKSPTGMAEMTYAFSELAKVSVGYSRFYTSTSLFRFILRDQGYVKYQHQVFGRLNIDLKAGVGYLQFGAPPPSAQVPNSDGNIDNRKDVFVDGELGLNFAATEWLLIGLVETFEYRTSNYNTAVARVNYFLNDLFLRVTARY